MVCSRVDCRRIIPCLCDRQMDFCAWESINSRNTHYCPWRWFSYAPFVLLFGFGCSGTHAALTSQFVQPIPMVWWSCSRLGKGRVQTLTGVYVPWNLADVMHSLAGLVRVTWTGEWFRVWITAARGSTSVVQLSFEEQILVLYMSR